MQEFVRYESLQKKGNQTNVSTRALITSLATPLFPAELRNVSVWTGLVRLPATNLLPFSQITFT